jgi:exoribonuclease-2
MPGSKITMLPDEVVQTFTLAEGSDCPAVSLYLDVTPGLAIVGEESRVEIVPIVANLRHHDIEPVFNDETVHGEGPDFQWKRELTLLWDLATVMEAGRGKAAGNEDRIDFGFSVDWTQDTADGPGLVSISRRLRGSPMDKLVAELMIYANMTWGKLLDKAGVPGLYRAQGGGKVRMTTVAAPHEALGVDCYAWSSSPLRRYVDLVNQWQIVSVLQGTPPAFAPKSADLMAALRDFELTYAEYAEFQRGMERYWCLRWLRQHGRGEVEATVLRESVVRLTEIPLMFRVPSMPLQMTGSRVKLLVEHTDLLDVEVEPLDATGGEKPRMVAFIREAECIGCTKCIQACPVDAIVGAAKQMHTVIVSECTGCDLCVEPCPVDCIDMIEIGTNVQSWKWERPLAPGQLIATDREQAA